LTGAAAVLFTALAATAVWAQRALKMTIPANPGGGWDQAGRLLLDTLEVVCFRSARPMPGG